MYFKYFKFIYNKKPKFIVIYYCYSFIRHSRFVGSVARFKFSSFWYLLLLLCGFGELWTMWKSWFCTLFFSCQNCIFSHWLVILLCSTDTIYLGLTFDSFSWKRLAKRVQVYLKSFRLWMISRVISISAVNLFVSSNQFVVVF